MKKNEKAGEKASLREVWTYNLRTLKLGQKIVPGLLFYLLGTALFGALIGFIGAVYSARILDMLSFGDPAEAFVRPVILLVASVFLLGRLGNLCSWQIRKRINIMFFRLRQFMSGVLLGVDYGALEDPDFKNRLRDYGSVRNATGEIVMVQVYAIDRLMQGVFALVSAAVLAWPTFTTGSGMVNLAVILSVVAAATAGGLVSHRKEKTIRGENLKAARRERLLHYYSEKVYAYTQGLDMRLYGAGEFAIDEQTRELEGDDFADMWGGLDAQFNAIGAAIQTFTVGCVYLFVAWRALSGLSSPGEVVRTVTAVTLIFTHLLSVTEQVAKLFADTRTQKLFFSIVDEPERMYKGSLTVEKRRDRNYEFELKDVSFKYPGSGEWALRHMDLKLNIGEKLALVGRNGSGKTTLIKLLCGLYEPTEGEVLLNGIDIRKYAPKEYQLLLSVVFQDFKLFALPLRDNVAASETVDEARMGEILDQVGFGERLKTLEKGLDTPIYKEIDEKGVEISGGEAQKLALARALYKNAPLIVLDEPTAALDPVAEYEVYAHFSALVGGRTAVYISHRLASCRFCDKIAVLDKGRLIQYGTHDELLAEEGGKYAEMWNAQAKYYNEEDSFGAENMVQ